MPDLIAIALAIVFGVCFSIALIFNCRYPEVWQFESRACATHRRANRQHRNPRIPLLPPPSLSIGFLHPHALSGGGGERVLWTAVRAVRAAYPDAILVLYSIWSKPTAADPRPAQSSTATPDTSESDSNSGSASTDANTETAAEATPAARLSKATRAYWHSHLDSFMFRKRDNIYDDNHEHHMRATAETTARQFGVDLTGVQFERVDISDIAQFCDAATYPRLTLLLQALGSAFFGATAYARRPVDVMIDTANLPFALAGPKWMLYWVRVMLKLTWSGHGRRAVLINRHGDTITTPWRVTTMAYTHYPVISTDMLKVVSLRETGVNNDASTAGSIPRTAFKISYYKMFAIAYYIIGRWAIDIPLANSSWTANHLATIWRRRVPVVFPPCPVSVEDDDEKKHVPQKPDATTDSAPGAVTKKDSRDGDDDANSFIDVDKDDTLIVSLGQFRPEKRHLEQVDIMDRVVKRLSSVQSSSSSSSTSSLKSATPSTNNAPVKLLMIGGARNDTDLERAHAVQRAVSERQLQPNVAVHINAPRADLARELQRAGIGLHTMRYEHFGIGVVELMSKGVIVIAHRSGGVALDIVRHGQNGLLADDVDGFVDAVVTVLGMTHRQRAKMRARARRHVRDRFSDERFEKGFLVGVRRCQKLVDNCG